MKITTNINENTVNEKEITVMEQNKINNGETETQGIKVAGANNVNNEEFMEELQEAFEERCGESSEKRPEFSYVNEEILSVDGRYVLEMVDTVVPENMVSAGIQLFLRDKETGELMIGNDNNLTIRRNDILNSDTYMVMNVIKKYDVSFSEDTIIKAWNKARELLHSGKMKKVGTSSSMTILEAYKAVVMEIIRRKNNNTDNTGKMGVDDYVFNGREACIKTTELSNVLDIMETGYKPNTFNKRLYLASAVNNFDYIKPTGHGFAKNTNQNVRYYKYNIPQDFYEELVNKGMVMNDAS